jgi:hypothetical protein
VGAHANPGIRPTLVEEYESYRRSGAISDVPTTEPPERLPGKTAGELALWWVGSLIASMALVALLVDVFSKSDLPAVMRALSVLVIGVGALVAFARLWAMVGRKNVAELRAGYTTLTLMFGTFWIGSGPRRWRGTGHRAPWDYAGVWVLDRSGRRVIQPPDTEREPPGFYPSPNRPDKLEFWTGVVWLGVYRDHP